MQTFADWVQFAVSSAVVLLLFSIVALLLVLIIKKKSKPGEEDFEIEHLNDKWSKEADRLRAAVLEPAELKKANKERAKLNKQSKNQSSQNKRVFVIDFEGDVAASQCAFLRDQITTIITLARPDDEVVVRIESPGGLVPSYGLAASQLARLREHKIKLTACVDKVAASGGYMMACVADKIVAAPFAIVGSIGVVVGLPNLNRFLKKHDIDYIEQTAGESKRTVSLFGELTEDKKAKQQAQLNVIHEIFKKHINQFRPNVDIAAVATGEIWLASEALKLNLVDELSTSDDLLLKIAKDAQIYLLKAEKKEDFKTRLIKKFFGRHINESQITFPMARSSHIHFL